MKPAQTMKRSARPPSGMPKGERFLRAAVLVTENATQAIKTKKAHIKEYCVVAFTCAEDMSLLTELRGFRERRDIVLVRSSAQVLSLDRAGLMADRPRGHLLPML